MPELHSFSPMRVFKDDAGRIVRASIYGRKVRGAEAVPLITLTLNPNLLSGNDLTSLVGSLDAAVQELLTSPHPYDEGCVGGVCPIK